MATPSLPAALSSTLVKDMQQRLPVNLNHLWMIKSSAAFLNNLINTSLEMATGKDKRPQVRACAHA